MKTLSTASFLAMCCACTGGQTGVPAERPAPEHVTCTNIPDAATALGVRGEELWGLVEGSHPLPLFGSRFQDQQRTELAPTTFTLTLERTSELLDQLSDCGMVDVPVRVRVVSTQPAIDVSMLGTVSGSLEHATLSFPPPSYLETAEAFDPHFSGWLSFEHGVPRVVALNTDEFTRWNTIKQETP